MAVMFVFEKGKKKKKLRSITRESNEALTTHSWFSPQGVLLYSCSDIAHKQPPWGIKHKDLDS